MSEKNNAAPVAQVPEIKSVQECVGYLNTNSEANKELNIYLQDKLDSNKYDVAENNDAFEFFKPRLIFEFVKEKEIMKLDFDQKTCKDFDNVILDFDTIDKVILNCRCRKSEWPFIENNSSARALILNINEKDKDKKISRRECVEFIGRFCAYEKYKALDADFVKQLLKITDIDDKEAKNKNTLFALAGFYISMDGYCIANAIDALPDEFCNDSRLLNMIFSVQDFSLFLKEPEVLMETIYYLIIRSEKYIQGKHVEAIKDVLENGDLYKQFRDSLEGCQISLNMEDMCASSQGCALAKVLFTNGLAMDVDDGKIKLVGREPDLDESVSLLQNQQDSLESWIKNVTNPAANKINDERAKEHQFKIDSFEDIKNLKVKLIKSYIEHSKDGETLKKVFKPLLDLEQSDAEEFSRRLNEMSLPKDAIQWVFRVICLKFKYKLNLNEDQFDEFKNMMRNLCYGISDPVITNASLLQLFDAHTLTSNQMEQLLDLQNISHKKTLFLPVYISRLKFEETLSNKLIDYFSKCSEIDKVDSQFQDERSVCLTFCSLIYQYIIHSPEYINRKDNGEDAIESVLDNDDKYALFRKNIINAITHGIKDKDGRIIKFNLQDIYKKENHINEDEKGVRKETPAKKLVDLLNANHLKLIFRFDCFQLESTLPQKAQVESITLKGYEHNFKNIEIIKNNGVNFIAGQKNANDNKSNQIELQDKPKEKSYTSNKVNSFEIISGVKKEDGKENAKNQFKNMKIIKNDGVNFIAEQKNANDNKSGNNKSNKIEPQNIDSINIGVQGKPKSEIFTSEEVNSFEIISKKSQPELKINENKALKKNYELSYIDSIQIESPNKLKTEYLVKSDVNPLQIIGNIKQEKNDNAKSNKIQKALLVVTVILFAVGLLTLSNVIFPVVLVKESVSIGIAILSFLLSGVSEFASRFLCLKNQSKDIESIAKSSDSAINKKNEYVNPRSRNIQEQKTPAGSMLKEQIGNDERSKSPEAK